MNGIFEEPADPAGPTEPVKASGELAGVLGQQLIRAVHVAVRPIEK